MANSTEEALEKYRESIKKRTDGLCSVLSKITSGNFSVKSKIRVPEKEDEFTELRSTLQIMIEKLKEREAIQKDKEKALTTTIRTEEKRRMDVEQKMEGLREKAEKRAQKIRKETERLRERFISDASHELRTPLAVLQTNLDLLSSLERSTKAFSGQAVKDDVKDVVESSKIQIKNLTNILEELTLLSKGRKPEEFRQEICLAMIIQETMEELMALVEAKNLTCKMEVLEPDLKVMGDETMLKKLMRNLISNAVKYGKKGGMIEISLKRQKGKAEIRVVDDGPGIPVKDIPYVFERFYRVDKGRTKEKGGVGLGLAICKWIIELHGGVIEVKSIYGKGSVFKVFLPLRGSPESRVGYWDYRARRIVSTLE